MKDFMARKDNILARIKKLKKGDAVAIRWFDCVSHIGWRNVNEEDFSEVVNDSVGFFMSADYRYFTTAQSWGNNDVVGEALSIPICCLIEVIPLGVAIIKNK